MEPKSQPIEKESHLPNLNLWVPAVNFPRYRPFPTLKLTPRHDITRIIVHPLHSPKLTPRTHQEAATQLESSHLPTMNFQWFRLAVSFRG